MTGKYLNTALALTLLLSAASCSKDIQVKRTAARLPQPSIWICGDMNPQYDTLYISPSGKASFRGRFVKQFDLKPSTSDKGVLLSAAPADKQPREYSLSPNGASLEVVSLGDEQGLAPIILKFQRLN